MDGTAKHSPFIITRNFAYIISLLLVFIWLSSYTLYQVNRENNLNNIFSLQLINWQESTCLEKKTPKLCGVVANDTSQSAVSFDIINLSLAINNTSLMRVINPDEIDTLEKNFINKFGGNITLLKKARYIAIESIKTLAERRAYNSQLFLLTTQPLTNEDEESKLLFDLQHAKTLINNYNDWSGKAAINEKNITLSLISNYNSLRNLFIIELQRNVKNFRPNVSFSWLYHDDNSGWVIELVFWTIAGLLCNTVIILNTSLTEENYSSNRFFLFIPRLFIAPILSIVVVALIAGGFTDAGVDLSNLPQFLILSFLLGFNVENLTQVIRRASNHFFGNFSFGKVITKEKINSHNAYIKTNTESSGLINKRLQKIKVKVAQQVRNIIADEKQNSNKDP